MFPDIGGIELIIVGIVALLVVKPQDLPVMMRKVGEFMGRARRMAADFRSSFDDMARQSELDTLRQEVEAMRTKASDPMGLNTALSETANEIQSSLSDPDFNYTGAQTEHVDDSIPWDDGVSTPVPAPKPARKKPAAAKTAPKAAPAKAAPVKTSAKPRAAKPIVEGGPKPRRTAAKAASKRTT